MQTKEQKMNFEDLDFQQITYNDLVIPSDSLRLMFNLYALVLSEIQVPDVYCDEKRVIIRSQWAHGFIYIEIFYKLSIINTYNIEEDLFYDIVELAEDNDFEYNNIPQIDDKQLTEFKPNLKNLNVCQTEAYKDILDWSKDVESGHILVGYAGSGKTYLLRLIAPMLKGAVLCAPTNKAVKELKKLNTGLECCTIYSLLGLKMEQYEDTIKLSELKDAPLPDYDYVVLDECGMTNSELFKHIKKAMRNGIKFLFVGDPKQLPPVGESKSQIWGSFPYSVLDTVMRHDNQILELATHVRESKIRDLDLKSNHSKNEGVWYLSRSAFERRIQKYARSGAFSENTKAIAWRNKTVDYMNNLVRYELYGEQIYSQKFFKGDKIVFTSPYKIDEQTSLFTDDEAEVLKIGIAKHRDYDLQCYHLTILIEKREYIIRVLHETAQSDFDRMLNDFAYDARQPKCGHLWQKFWQLRNSFGSVKYSYALTAHRGQGSTYENVFVDTFDILTNPNKNEAKKCLYVGVTRPSQRLFLT